MRTRLVQFDITPTGEVSREFLTHGLVHFRQAAQFVKQLPYGRNTDRSDYRLVLSEGRGTCSTKHALLASYVWNNSRTRFISIREFTK